MAYTQRYGGGFGDGNPATPVDSQYLNAVEAALLKLYGLDPSADGQALLWKVANTRFEPALIKDANIDAAAAISKSKLGALGIVNADVAANAAINASKLAGYPGDVKTFLRGDGGWQKGGMNLLWDSVDAGVALPAASMTTPALDQSFKHLIIMTELRSDNAGITHDVLVRVGINGGAIDSGGNYNHQRLYVAGTGAVLTAETISASAFIPGIATGGGADNNVLGYSLFVFPHYSSSQRHGFTGISTGQVGSSAATGANRITLHGGIYKNTVGGITSLQFSLSAGNIAAGRISIYGV